MGITWILREKKRERVCVCVCEQVSTFLVSTRPVSCRRRHRRRSRHHPVDRWRASVRRVVGVVSICAIGADQ